MEYNFAEFEPKWQMYWEENKTFRTSDDLSRPKYYILDMFPYPSGAGLHVGHPEGYTATDIITRYKRMKGFNVLHPMGWDAFGLPAEQYAMQTGTHPSVTTKNNCDTFRRQIKSLGLAYDWEREVNTTDPKYYKWTQWIFKQLYNTWFDEQLQKGRPIGEITIPDEISEKGKNAVNEYIAGKRLAYYDHAQVWWCNECRTVCANEEVLNDGSHEKCGNQVIRKNLKQWLLRIPHYAERLLNGLEKLDWPTGIKEAQRNWIGRSTGAEVDFQIQGADEKLRVYTTRPDTLFGVTYMVVAPEHPFVKKLTVPEQVASVEEYVKLAALKSDLDRTDLAKQKTGVFLGSYAINPVNDRPIPIWVADYVLMGYGTGAIMAVPAHDTRDFEFAQQFDLSIECILDPKSARGEERDLILKGEQCWTEDGLYINSSSEVTGLNINGLNKEEGIKTTIAWLESKGIGKATVNFKMRDWLFSRQRFWGEPFPVIHWEDGEVTLLNDDELPLELPHLEKYTPGETGESPLSNAGDWLNVVDANGRKGRRETNTMPQWAGSCWYYLRYIDPQNESSIFDPEKEKYWMPVDLYIGGAEHAVLHLLYSRFWHKVLFDLGIVSTDEPFIKLFNQGMILAYAHETATGAKVASDSVKKVEETIEIIATTTTTTTILTTTTTTLPNQSPFSTKQVEEILTSLLFKNGVPSTTPKTTFKHIVNDEDLNQIVAKMSKSLKNVVNPDDVVSRYGADALRLYEMFMGPLDERKPWSDTGVKGVYNFLSRVYRFFADTNNINSGEENSGTMRLLHQTIKKVGQDIENLKFNTAISALMVFNNHAIKAGKVSQKTAETFALILSPFAPHLGEELWSIYGNHASLAGESWPVYDESLLEVDSFEYPVSFNGKLRFKLELPLDITDSDAREAVLANEKAAKWLENGTVRNFVFVKGKIINVVVVPA